MEFIKSIEEFNQVIKKDFVMVIAKSHTCTACNTIYDMMKRSVSNLDDIEVKNVYVDDLDEIRGKHLIFSVPTVLIFSEGKELLRESRYINYSKIERLIELYRN